MDASGKIRKWTAFLAVCQQLIIPQISKNLIIQIIIQNFKAIYIKYFYTKVNNPWFNPWFCFCQVQTLHACQSSTYMENLVPTTLTATWISSCTDTILMLPNKFWKTGKGLKVDTLRCDIWHHTNPVQLSTSTIKVPLIKSCG